MILQKYNKTLHCIICQLQWKSIKSICLSMCSGFLLPLSYLFGAPACMTKYISLQESGMQGSSTTSAAGEASDTSVNNRPTPLPTREIWRGRGRGRGRGSVSARSRGRGSSRRGRGRGQSRGETTEEARQRIKAMRENRIEKLKVCTLCYYSKYLQVDKNKVGPVEQNANTA